MVADHALDYVPSFKRFRAEKAFTNLAMAFREMKILENEWAESI